MNALKNQGLTLALLGACALAFLYPELGARGGLLRTELTTKIAVAAAFFLQGLSLRGRQLIHSATRFRVMLFCQSWIFALCPAIMIGIAFVTAPWVHPGIRDGLLYLSVLPTTISSAIILTASFRGDAATALFNSTLANLLGVVITPLWCSALFSNAGEQLPPLFSLISKIALLVILPIIVAQVLRPRFRDTIEARKPLIRSLSNAMIIFIVFASFCNSVASGMWATLPLSSIAAALLFSLVYLLLISSLVWTSSAIADPDRSQRIAAFFCGSQKTLAAGAPMASIIFAQSSPATQGLIILPLILYHSLQLFLAGIVGPKLAKGPPDRATK